MELEEIGKEIMKWDDLYRTKERSIRIMTGAGGYELIQEAMEKAGGFYRIYIGKKVVRILRRLKTPILKSSLSKRYYKLMKSGQVF